MPNGYVTYFISSSFKHAASAEIQIDTKTLQIPGDVCQRTPEIVDRNSTYFLLSITSEYVTSCRAQFCEL